MATSYEPNAKVLFRIPNGDGSDEVETMWACDLGEDRYRLDNCPFYAYGVSLHDIVYAPLDPTEEFPTFRSVVSKSGNRTIRVIFDPPLAAGNESERKLGELRALGCDCERATSSYVVLNIPPSIDLAGVADNLIRLGLTWEHADPTYDELHSDKS
jgi:hypothetical protein